MGVGETGDSVGREFITVESAPILGRLQGDGMRPTLGNADHTYNIIIYAQSGALAGDLAALLSGHHRVNLQSNLSGVLQTIHSSTDVLLLVKDKDGPEQVDPMEILNAARRVSCKIILLGCWNAIEWKKIGNRIVILQEMPSPSVLLEVIRQP